MFGLYWAASNYYISIIVQYKGQLNFILFSIRTISYSIFIVIQKVSLICVIDLRNLKTPGNGTCDWFQKTAQRSTYCRSNFLNVNPVESAEITLPAVIKVVTQENNYYPHKRSTFSKVLNMRISFNFIESNYWLDKVFRTNTNLSELYDLNIAGTVYHWSTCWSKYKCMWSVD